MPPVEFAGSAAKSVEAIPRAFAEELVFGTPAPKAGAAPANVLEDSLRSPSRGKDGNGQGSDTLAWLSTVVVAARTGLAT